MYILDFLSGSSNVQPGLDVVTFEYRLLCSGELFNAHVVATDWRKTDISRILLDQPFTLIVCSHPFNAFPQEIALQFSVPLAEEVRGQSTSMFWPDEDIAGDVAALMTLLCRRLVTVAAKVRERYSKQYEDEPPFFQDWPIGFANSLRRTHWQPKPSAIISGPAGVMRIKDYNPPPLGVDSVRLKRLLLGLPKLPLAESFILSVRLYNLALEQLERDVTLTYQLLIAAAETMANEALLDFTPNVEDMLLTKKSVADLALEFGLCKEQSHQLAIAACKDMSWAKRKFTKFLMDNTTDQLWREDDLFRVPPELLPDKGDFGDKLAMIYGARGKLLHAGHAFPTSSMIGIGPTVPSRVFMDLDFSSKPFPPVVWFERVVNYALSNFLESSLPLDNTMGQRPSMDR